MLSKMKMNENNKTTLFFIFAIIVLLSTPAVAVAEKEKVQLYYTIERDIPEVTALLDNALQRYFKKDSQKHEKEIAAEYYSKTKELMRSRTVYQEAKKGSYILGIKPEKTGKDTLRIYFTLQKDGRLDSPLYQDCSKDSLDQDIQNTLDRIRSVILGEPYKIVFIYCFNGAPATNELRNRIFMFLPDTLNEELKSRKLNKKYQAYTEIVDCVDLEKSEQRNEQRNLRMAFLKKYDYFIEGTMTPAEMGKLDVTVYVFISGKPKKPLRSDFHQTAPEDDVARELAKYILNQWHTITGE